MAQYGFHFDMNRCYACQACDVACKDWHGIKPGAEKWLSIYEWETGTFPEVRLHALAYSCGHCEKPACLAVCPEDAIRKDPAFSAVLVDREKCTGCRICYDACPYGAPKFATDDPSCKMSKCDMCIDRLRAGEKPVCAVSCPLRAFDFGPVDELVGKYTDIRYCEGMPDPSTTEPAYLIWPQREKTRLVSFDAQEAIRLNQQRGDLGTLFENPNDVSSIEEGTVARNKLRMKFANTQEMLRATRNDMA